MLSVENVSVMNFDNAVRGMRNPLSSWSKMDSTIASDGSFIFGENDLKLAKSLCRSGSDHRKFVRQIFVSVDITAPMYWWKEFDTYKVATVANSTSTMHKIHAKPFEIEDFSHDHMNDEAKRALISVIDVLESLRLRFNEKKDKALWYSIIQLLPSSYNQMRTVTMNYETLVSMYHSRKRHKLQEWHTYCDWIESLPYFKEMMLQDK
ncbi:MAG: hypothetical protein IJV62_03355 [Eggerthellaceae bacterium]|nr:hypothetical protein [Eggerthellaceae bacterium]